MIRDQILKDLSKILEKLRISPENLALEHPQEESFGDYSTNIALRVKKRDFANPVDLANHIVNTWRASGLPAYLAKIEVVKPGFINLWLKEETLINQVEEVLKKKQKYGSSFVGKGKTVVVDYSGPNIARPFGIGHLRSTIIGQAIYNLYQFLGWRTIGINHLGDWGTQFGKLIVAIKRWNKGKVKGLTVEDLEKLYVKFHKEVEKRPKLAEEARAWFKKLEEKDVEARKIWRACVEISLKEFARIYQILGVKIDYSLGESFYEDKMATVVEEAKRKNLAQESEGALIMPLPGFKTPLMLLKSDGATTYHLRDLACVQYRKKHWKPDLYIYETGVDHKLHFQQLFAAVEKLGYGKLSRFVHVAHGMIRLPTGKMSTRKGKTVHLEDVFNEAIQRAQKIIEESETSRGLSKKEKEKVASAVGIGAVKYSDLKQNPQTDIIFDWEKIFNLEGDSGPYLQYTYARCQSVLQKAKKQGLGISYFRSIGDKYDIPGRQILTEESLLLRTIYKFPEVIQEAAENFSPNLLCAFLFDLAQKYNVFYNKQPILKSAKGVREARLALTQATAQVLKNGLNLLGIEVLERM